MFCYSSPSFICFSSLPQLLFTLVAIVSGCVSGNGYIPTSSLREILAALDDQLTSDQLNEMISEIDTDGSGTVDFDEFMEMMTGD